MRTHFIIYDEEIYITNFYTELPFRPHKKESIEISDFYEESKITEEMIETFSSMLLEIESTCIRKDSKGVYLECYAVAKGRK